VAQNNENNIWYLPSAYSGEADGPFSTQEIKAKVKEGQLGWDNFIWSEKLPKRNWYRLIEVEEFRVLQHKYPNRPLPKFYSQGDKTKAKPQLTKFFRRQGEYGKENLYRRFPRVALSAEAIIHNNKKICRGMSVDFSEMGMFVSVDNTNLFEKGEEVVITLRGVPSIETFSVNAAILRVISEGNITGYAFHFLRVKPKTRRLIAKYVLSELEIETRCEVL